MPQIFKPGALARLRIIAEWKKVLDHSKHPFLYQIRLAAYVTHCSCPMTVRFWRTKLIVRSGHIFLMMYNASYDHYRNTAPSIRDQYTGEYLTRSASAAGINHIMGVLMDDYNTDGSLNQEEARSLKAAIDQLYKLAQQYPVPMAHMYRTFTEDIERLKHIEPSYVAPNWDINNSNSGGCYIATAVYGSYDCPQVWVLRRFRDFVLAPKWYGQLFIKAYYMISPVLVKWFGATKWFKKSWRKRLDPLILQLKEKGFADTPYDD